MAEENGGIFSVKAFCSRYQHHCNNIAKKLHSSKENRERERNLRDDDFFSRHDENKLITSTEYCLAACQIILKLGAATVSVHPKQKELS